MKNARSKISGRRLLLLLLLAGFVALVTSRFTDLQDLVGTLARGRWQWVLASLMLHAIYFGFYARLYQVGFQAVEVESEARKLLPVFFASLFINALTPTGGTGGAALFVDDAVQRGQSGARAAVGMVLVLVADLITLVPFVIVGVLFLYAHNELRLYHIVGVALFLAFVTVLTGALVLARRRLKQLRRLFGWVQRLVNRVGNWFKRTHLLAADWPDRNADQFADAAGAIVAHPQKLTLALGLGMLLHLINIFGLYLLFLAFEQPVGLETLIAGFAMGIVFFVIAVFQGAGVVEAVMTLVYTTAGIPQTKAVVITLTYRGIIFWMPLLIGFFFLGRVRSFKSRSAPDSGPEKAGEAGSRPEHEGANN